MTEGDTMGKGCCPFCQVPIRPTETEAVASEWAFRLADPAAPGGSRGGVLYRLKCPACTAPLIAGPSQQWAGVDPAAVEWSRDVNAHLIFGG
jgi:hypothetical protein